MEVYRDFVLGYTTKHSYFGYIIKDDTKQYIMIDDKLEIWNNTGNQNERVYFDTIDKIKQAIDKYWNGIDSEQKGSMKELFPKFEDVKKMTLVPSKYLKYLFDKEKISVEFDKLQETVARTYYKHFKRAYEEGMFVDWTLKEKFLEPKIAIAMMLDGKKLLSKNGNICKYDEESTSFVLTDKITNEVFIMLNFIDLKEIKD